VHHEKGKAVNQERRERTAVVPSRLFDSDFERLLEPAFSAAQRFEHRLSTSGRRERVEEATPAAMERLKRRETYLVGLEEKWTTKSRFQQRLLLLLSRQNAVAGYLTINVVAMHSTTRWCEKKLEKEEKERVTKEEERGGLHTMKKGGYTRG
jgi:hypothetical protein